MMPEILSRIKKETKELKFRTAATLAFVSVLCLASTVVTAADTTARWLPDPHLTPGAINPDITQANIGQTICKKGWSTKSIRPPVSYTNPLKRKDIKLYGYRDTNMHDYELDHLISLEIGGAPRDPKNLWPEPYQGQWNAHLKDRLENRLHKLVCTGKLTLRQAQASIVNNWIQAYKRYVLKEPEVAEAP